MRLFAVGLAIVLVAVVACVTMLARSRGGIAGVMTPTPVVSGMPKEPAGFTPTPYRPYQVPDKTTWEMLPAGDAMTREERTVRASPL